MHCADHHHLYRSDESDAGTTTATAPAPVPAPAPAPAPAPVPNGSKAVTLLLRLSTLALALASAIVMATARECTINGLHGGTAIVTFKKSYPPLFVYLVAANITATILEVAAVYLQFGKGDDSEEAPIVPGSVLVVVDVAIQMLLYSATGAVIAAAAAYGAQISACAGGGGSHFYEQVDRSKFISFAASLSACLAAIVKDVSLPFSVWPDSSG